MKFRTKKRLGVNSFIADFKGFNPFLDGLKWLENRLWFSLAWTNYENTNHLQILIFSKSRIKEYLIELIDYLHYSVEYL